MGGGFSRGALARGPQPDAGSARRPHPSRWTDQTVSEYQDWVGEHGLEYVASGRRFGCADWTLTVLMDFARTRNLPIRLQLGAFSSIPAWVPAAGSVLEAHRYNAGEPIADDQFGGAVCASGPPIEPGAVYENLESTAHQLIGAADAGFLQANNTLEIDDSGDLEPGDLIILPGLIQLVYRFASRIRLSGASTELPVLEVIEGNLPAVELERKAWRLDGPGHYAATKSGWTRSDDRDFRALWGDDVAHGRRWNFELFNSAESVRR